MIGKNTITNLINNVDSFLNIVFIPAQYIFVISFLTLLIYFATLYTFPLMYKRKIFFNIVKILVIMMILSLFLIGSYSILNPSVHQGLEPIAE